MRLAKTKMVPGVLTDEGVEVREINVETLESCAEIFIKIYGGGDEVEFSLVDFIKEFKEKLPMVCSIEKDQIGQLSMSEIKAIFEACKEVNNDFLLILEALGMKVKGLEIEKKSEESKNEPPRKLPDIEKPTESHPNQVESEKSQNEPQEKTEREFAPSLSPVEFLAKQKELQPSGT